MTLPVNLYQYFVSVNISITNSIILTLATLSYIISKILWHKIHVQIKSLKKMSAWWGFWWILLKNVFSPWSTLCHLPLTHLISWFQTNAHTPKAPMKSSSIPVSCTIIHSFSHSGQRSCHYPESSLSLTSNIQSISKFCLLCL